MAIEIEKKYRLAAGDRERIEQRLREVQAVFERDEFEENTIFELTQLTGRRGILRIRRVGSRTILTLKRRITSGSSAKQQMEHETDVTDHDELKRIVLELGLTPAVIYEKRRSTWKFGNVEVVLDELPFGNYMEIEGSEAEIFLAETALRISDLESEPQTYPTLTATYGIDNGGVKEARFD